MIQSPTSDQRRLHARYLDTWGAHPATVPAEILSFTTVTCNPGEDTVITDKVARSTKHRQIIIETGKSSSKQANHPSQAAKSSNNSSILLNPRSENLEATPPTNESPSKHLNSPCPVGWNCREFPQRWKRGSLNTSKTTYTTFAVARHHIRVHLIVSSSSRLTTRRVRWQRTSRLAISHHSYVVG
jgi:hypothetical protein